MRDLQPGGSVEAQQSRALGDGGQAIVGGVGLVDFGVKLMKGFGQPPGAVKS